MKSNLKRLIIGTTIASTMVTSSILPSFALSSSHKVVSGDTLWKISQKYNISLNDIYNANPKYRQNPEINIGEIVKIPGLNTSTYIVEKNDTPWIISNKFGVNLNELLKVNHLENGKYIYPGQSIIIPKAGAGSSTNITPPSLPNTSSPSVTYKNHIVVQGDDMWKISVQYGVPFQELLKLNKISENHILNLGDVIKIPVYNIPVKPTPGAKYGELLDWWTEAQYVVPIGKVFKVVDFYTGKSWTMKRTIGANHSDTEPLTARDAAIMKEVWGGSYNWNARPVIVEVDNRKIAASATSTPHSIQYINNNNFSGHCDIHFYNSTRHKDGLKDMNHQNNVLISAGRK